MSDILKYNERLEAWLNADPEMRWIEVMIGDKYRWCVRFWQTTFEEPGSYKVSEREAGTLEEAFKIALVTAEQKEGR